MSGNDWETVNAVINNNRSAPDVWAPPEPDDPPIGWGGWAVVQRGLISFERAKYARDENGNVIWRWIGMGPWRHRDGFWADAEQSARCLRDGHLRIARETPDGIVYENEPLTSDNKRYLRNAIRAANRRKN